MHGLLEWLGVDPVQWKALVVAYLRMDTRRGGGAVRPQEKGGRHPSAAYAGLLFITALSSLFLGVFAIALRNPLTVAMVVTTYAALNTALLLLVDFTTLVVSPDDYTILASRPVDSRTYLAARLTSVLVYVLAIAGIMASMPAAVLALWHGLGIRGFLATIVATLMCSGCAAVLVTAIYARLISVVHPKRLMRVLSYLQLIASTTFLGGYYVMTVAFEQARLRNLSIRDIDWVWAIPSAWFAAFVPMVTGSGGSREAMASIAAVALALVCVPLATGRLSLDYAAHLSEISATSEPSKRTRPLRIPGFREGEAFAVAILVRAQFRYDSRFRLAILGMLPITAFYIVLGLKDGTVADPFVSGVGGAGAPLYFAVVFLPMTLHSSLLLSDSWRSAWVFFATPADPAKLIVAAKNFVGIFFLGTYVGLLALVWSFFYQSILHAVVHAAVIGTLAHFLLQSAAILRPALPFAAEPHKAERSSRIMGLFFWAAILSGIIPLFLPFFYARISRTLLLALVLLTITVGLETLLRKRARAAVLGMEFRS